MNLKTITSINGIPCNLVKAEHAKLLLTALKKMLTQMLTFEDAWIEAGVGDLWEDVVQEAEVAIKQATQP